MLKVIRAVLVTFITTPIQFYLMYWLLKANNAGDLQMFLFWVYIPFMIVGVFLAVLITEK